MTRIAGFTAALTLVAAVAYGQDVSYNYDQQADFTKYRTYQWVQVKDGEQIDPLTAQQITAAFEKQLALKGLTKAAGDQADLAVAYQVAVSEEKEIRTMDSGMLWTRMGPPLLWRLLRWRDEHDHHIDHLRGLGRPGHVRQYLQESGVAQHRVKRIDTKASPEKRDKNLNKGAEKMLKKNFPPKSKTTR